jgi:hypothetical protein
VASTILRSIDCPDHGAHQMELELKHLIAAAAAAFALTLTFGAASAAPEKYSTDDDIICLLLEAAGESNCAEFDLVRSSTKDVATSMPEQDVGMDAMPTGSIAGTTATGAGAPYPVQY